MSKSVLWHWAVARRAVQPQQQPEDRAGFVLNCGFGASVALSAGVTAGAVCSFVVASEPPQQEAPWPLWVFAGVGIAFMVVLLF